MITTARIDRLRTLYLEWSPLGSSPDYWAPLSYVLDWRRAFVTSPLLDVTYCDINRPSQVIEAATNIANYDLIVVSHIALGDDVNDIARWTELLSRRTGKLVSFIGNEYDLMAEKIAFLRDAKVDIVCSQLALDAAEYFYEELTDAKIISLPHALNPDDYHAPAGNYRPTDIGFIGAVYPAWVGDLERTMMILATQEIAPLLSLKHDIRLQNLPRAAWAEFLGKTRAVIGAESGSYYLHRKGQLLSDAKQWCAANPTAQFEEVEARFFTDRSGVPSGKTISSRHFEPIGTRTCQVLVEGSYAGVLVPNEHYIPVRKDMMDLPDALRRAADETERLQMVNRAYEYAMDAHTHAHRVETLVGLL